MEKNILKYEDFSPDLKNFIDQNQIPIESYDITHLNRFFRLVNCPTTSLTFRINPRNPISYEELKIQFAEYNVVPKPVDWLPQFYFIPVEIKISSTDAYKSGKIFGIDASSAIVVKALDPGPGDHILDKHYYYMILVKRIDEINQLDLCCAPGAKTCMIFDEMNTNPIEDKEVQVGSITGVDNSEMRLSSCRTLCSKYQIPNMRLFLDDARSFSILSPEGSDKDNDDNNTNKNSEKSNKRRKNNHNNIQNINNGDERKVEEIEIEYREEISVKGNEKVKSDEVNELNLGNEEIGIRDIYDTKVLEVRETRKEVVCLNNDDKEKLERKRKHEQNIKKKQKRLMKKKKSQNSQPNLFYCTNWRFRDASNSKTLYDKILLDAHCTLDASVRHILKYQKLGWKEYTPNISEVTSQLQKEMISNAFNLLKPGGILVYSTCSFSKQQNEDVVQWLIDKEPTAISLPIVFRDCSPPVTTGYVANTVRLYPKNTGTSGIFIAKLKKLAKDEV